ncbi:MAG: hypothetical protein M3112_09755 [Actinomycetia bacterium]|nr:hypothetical protein [Actinomycetes bacterium]
MVASSLQDDLLRIQGVEGAEVDGSQDAPAGLRIRIAEGADQEAVGEAIRLVLSSHGLGTDTQLPGEDTPLVDEEPAVATEGEPSSVAVMTDDEAESSPGEDHGGGAVIDLTDKVSTVVAVDDDGSDDTSVQTEAAETVLAEEGDLVPPFVEQRPAAVAEAVPEDSDALQVAEDQPSPISARDSIARIDSVAVVEGRSGIIVTVTASNGTEMSQVASSSEGGVEAAVVRAAASLVDPASPDPVVVEIEDRRVEGVDIVMIVLDMDGELFAGSAVVAAGRAFALGRAAWAALAL